MGAHLAPHWLPRVPPGLSSGDFGPGMFGCCFSQFLAVPLPAHCEFAVHVCPSVAFVPYPHALSCVLCRQLVPMIFLYFVCYALPGADAMDDSSFSGSSSGGDYTCTRELSSLSADTWEAFAFYFKNMAKLKRLVLLFHLPLDAVAHDLLDFGCLGEYGDVSEGEDPCNDAPENRLKDQPQLLVQPQHPFHSFVGCLFRSSVSRILPCMACWVLHAPSV